MNFKRNDYNDPDSKGPIKYRLKGLRNTISVRTFKFTGIYTIVIYAILLLKIA